MTCLSKREVAICVRMLKEGYIYKGVFRVIEDAGKEISKYKKV